MFGFLFGRWKEGKALRAIEEALRRTGPAEAALNAVRGLRATGSAQSIPILCSAVTRGSQELQAEALAALAAVHKRHPDNRALETLNATALSERQPEALREAAIQALSEVVDSRHAGSFIEVLRKPSTSLRIRAAAVQALKRVRYPETLERLVENYLFDRKDDPQDAIRQWAIQELHALEDKDKIVHIHEIAHGRRRLRHRVINLQSNDPPELVYLMAEVDPVGSARFLGQMADHSTKIIAVAAQKALSELRAKQKANEAQRR